MFTIVNLFRTHAGVWEELGWVKSSKTLFLTSPQITYILIYNMCKCDGMTCMQHARMLRAPSLLRLNSFQEIT